MSLMLPTRAMRRDGRAIRAATTGSSIQPSTTWTKVPGTTADQYVGGGVTSGANWRLNAPAAGRYRITANLPFSVNEDVLVEFGLGVNGAAPSRSCSVRPGSSREEIATVTDVLELDAFDYVEPFCRIMSSATADVSMRAGIGAGLLMHRCTGAPGAPVYEMIFDMRFVGETSFDPPLSGAGRAIGVGGGGAGLAAVGAGGGAACTVLELDWDSDVTYTTTSGTGGTVGADGVDSELTDGVTTLALAVAGKGRTNGGAGGLAADCVGTFRYSGSDGETGAATEQGGGSGGSEADATGPYGGEPNGAPSRTSATANSFGSGGASQASNSRPGAAGRWILEYPQEQDEAFPWQVDFIEGRDVDDFGTRDVVLPDAVDGDLLVMTIAEDAAPTMTMAGDWTRLTHTAVGSIMRCSVFVTEKSPSTTVAVATASDTRCTWHIRSFRNHSGVADVEATDVGTTLTASPTPPTHTPSQGTDNYLFLVFASWDANLALNLTAFPASHLSRMFTPSFDEQSVRMASCFRRLTASSHSAGAFGSTAEDNVLGVVSIRAA